ncbi:hypothetical protein FRB91_002994, partial [Serendipita sp. 411]
MLQSLDRYGPLLVQEKRRIFHYQDNQLLDSSKANQILPSNVTNAPKAGVSRYTTLQGFMLSGSIRTGKGSVTPPAEPLAGPTFKRLVNDLLEQCRHQHRWRHRPKHIPTKSRRSTRFH